MNEIMGLSPPHACYIPRPSHLHKLNHPSGRVIYFFPASCPLFGPNIPLRILLSNDITSCEISGSHGDEYEDDVFYDLKPCSLVEITVLMMEAKTTLKRRSLSTRLHGATSQKAVNFAVTLRSYTNLK
jgi:hypothetical protein